MTGGKYDSYGKKRRVIIDAPFIDQREKYPTGCESVTAVMALNHLGLDIKPDEFINDYLEKGGRPHEKEGITVGANPRKAFVGNPYSPDDYGCYAPVIKKAMEKVLDNNVEKKSGSGNGTFGKDIPGEEASDEEVSAKGSSVDDMSGGYSVIDASGLPLEQLCARYIRKGTPVILWATMYMRHTFRGDTWRDETDPSISITWRNNEHCLLLVGYDKKYYYFNDPLLGAKVRFTKSAVQRAHKSMFRQALVVGGG